jgi:hypothetical protein
MCELSASMLSYQPQRVWCALRPRLAPCARPAPRPGDGTATPRRHMMQPGATTRNGPQAAIIAGQGPFSLVMEVLGSNQRRLSQRFTDRLF